VYRIFIIFYLTEPELNRVKPVRACPVRLWFGSGQPHHKTHKDTELIAGYKCLPAEKFGDFEFGDLKVLCR